MLSRRLFLTLTGGTLAAPRVLSGAVGFPAMLDHILLGCRDLDEGIEFVEKQTGVRAAFGGVHPGRGTRNALLSLSEKHYLEIIAPDPDQSEVPDRLGLQKFAEPRIVGWAAHPGNLDEFASRLRAANVAFDGPTPGSRKRPDGHLLEWKTVNLRDDFHGLLPFFIEWSRNSLHPSADAPAACKIFDFQLATTDTQELERRCNRLELDVRIVSGDRNRIDASILSSKGIVVLSSQKPPFIMY